MTYETLILAEPTLPREGIDDLLGKVRAQIEKVGGTINKVDEWGVRRLAYEVKKHADGFYVLYEFEAPTSSVRPLDDYLRLQAPIMRFRTTVRPKIKGQLPNADHPSFRERR